MTDDPGGQPPAASIGRRRFLTSVALGGLGAALVTSPAFAAPAVGAARDLSAGAAAAVAEPTAVEPAGGAGLFDVDVDQGGVSQDPNAVLTGDVSALPVDWGF